MTAAVVIFTLAYVAIAIAFGSNAGSVATLTGNPQNMIVGTLSGISYARLSAALALPAVASVVLVAATLQLMFRRELPARLAREAALEPPTIDRRLLLLWLATALSATLAGNLTIVGSVANLIVLELAGDRGHVGFWRFLRYGSVVTALTLAASLAILIAEHRAGWPGPTH